MALTKGTPNSTWGNNVNQIDCTFTQMAGSNRKLVVVFGDGSDGAAPSAISAITLGGTTLTQVGTITNGAGPFSRVYIWERNDASSGTITITASNMIGNLGYVEWSGADSAALVSTTNSATNNTITITTNSTTAGDAVVAGFAHYNPENPPHTMGGGQTAEWDYNTAGATASSACSTKAAGGDITQTQSITNTRAWTAVQTVVKAAGAAATPGFMWLS